MGLCGHVWVNILTFVTPEGCKKMHCYISQQFWGSKCYTSQQFGDQSVTYHNSLGIKVVRLVQYLYYWHIGATASDKIQHTKFLRCSISSRSGLPRSRFVNMWHLCRVSCMSLNFTEGREIEMSGGKDKLWKVRQKIVYFEDIYMMREMFW